MKSFFRIAIFTLAFILCLGAVGCAKTDGITAEGDPANRPSSVATTGSVASSTTAKCEECQYSSAVEIKAKTFEEGVMKYTCDVCRNSYTEPIPATKSIKILAVGNSFSVNAMEYLYDICKAGGVEEIILGNLYISGCTLQTHLSNINGDKAVYEYYLNTSGKWNKIEGTSLKIALKQTDWDVITVQQSSANSGKTATFTPLEDIVKYLKKEATNTDVKLFWHMTWAYQSDFTKDLFANYNYNQKTMYNSIINAVKSDVANREYIDGIIPAGTAIQNLRTSYFGDSLTRDGYHLNYEEGYYTAALAWFAYITGGSMDNIEWTPAAYPNLKDHIPVMREAVKNAIDKPYEVTNSTFTEAPNMTIDWSETNVPDLDYDVSDTDADRFTKLGLDIDDYELLDWGAKMYTLYSSTGGTTRHDSTSSSLSQYYISSERLYKTDLPIGSIIIVDKGFQYRPEGWESESYKSTSATREPNVLASVVTVDKAWWKNYEFRGFNLSPEGTRVREVLESDIGHLRIYVPKL